MEPPETNLGINLKNKVKKKKKTKNSKDNPNAGVLAHDASTPVKKHKYKKNFPQSVSPKRNIVSTAAFPDITEPIAQSRGNVSKLSNSTYTQLLPSLNKPGNAITSLVGSNVAEVQSETSTGPTKGKKAKVRHGKVKEHKTKRSKMKPQKINQNHFHPEEKFAAKTKLPKLQFDNQPSTTGQARVTFSSEPVPAESGDIATDQLSNNKENLNEAKERSTYDAVFSGTLRNLPPLSSKIVRIFTSSTFTDTTFERNALMERVYPKIKEYCREKHGLEFQVVDMRWGVRDEATDDHMTTSLCLNEIENCQRLSVGPNFIVILGNKYGFRPIPTFIDSAEFELIVHSPKLSTIEVDLLNKWYLRDENKVPAEYVLQTISSILTNFNNKRMPHLQEADQNAWWDSMLRMQRILRKATQHLYLDGKISETQMHNYFMAVTEREVIHGILQASEPKTHCLAYIRAITNINTNAVRSARNYIDFVGHRVDQEAQHLLEKLKTDKLPRVLDKENICHVSVPWQDPAGMAKENLQNYLSEFCDRFYSDVIYQIDNGVSKNNEIGKDRVLSEILQHLHMTNNFCKVFQGRNEIIKQIYDYVLDDSNDQIFVIYGDSGCGKTSVLAKAASLASGWLRTSAYSLSSLVPQSSKWQSIVSTPPTLVSPNLVIRFLGTSPDSSSLAPLLTSLSVQIAYLQYLENLSNLTDEDGSTVASKNIVKSPNNIQENTEDADVLRKTSTTSQPIGTDPPPSEISQLVLHLRRLLNKATPTQPLIIFLDSLDQLSTVNNAHLLHWLPDQLPKNVKLVVSTLTGPSGLVAQLKQKVELPKNLVAVNPLGQKLAEEVLQFWLANTNKTLTNDQWNCVTEALSKCSLPLFVKLVFDDVCRWRSYFSMDSTRLSGTIQESVHTLLNRIENQHGRELVTRALSYITASKSGISEAELEDVLSLDEKVLNDVYQYHLPPVRRIPPLLWTRIRNDLPGYLAEREADGINVVHWYHRQFVEVARARYFRNLNYQAEIHSTLADYYLGKWAGIAKPFEYDDLQKTRFNLDSTRSESDRRVSPQPLVLGEAREGRVLRYNLRKLSELPFHLIRAKRLSELFDRCLFSLDFLTAKLSGLALQWLLQDLQEVLEITEHRDTVLLLHTLRLAASVVTRHPDMLGPQITGRLLPYYSSYPHIRSLIQQADSEGLQRCRLAPAYHFLHTPGGPLEFSLEGHLFAPFGITATSAGRYLVSVSNHFLVWDLASGDTFRSNAPIGLRGIMQNLTTAPCLRYTFAYANSNQIIRYHLPSGESVVWSNPLIGGPADDSEDVVGMTTTSSLVLVWTRSSWSVINSESGTVLARCRLPSETALLYQIVQVEIKSNTNHLIIVTQCLPQVTNTPLNSAGGNSSNDLDNDDILMFELANYSTFTTEFLSAFFKCNSGLVLFQDGCKLFTCTNKTGNDIVYFTREHLGAQWIHQFGLSNDDKVYSLMLSDDENYLVATVQFGFKLWKIQSSASNTTNSTYSYLFLALPKGLRNIPTKNLTKPLIIFTQNNTYVVTTVRTNLYAYSTETGKLENTLDAHFGRIIGLCGVSESNKVVSSSMDKTVKVWNFGNIGERVFSIDRNERSVDDISLSPKCHIGATRTRNAVGIWDLTNGNLTATLSTGRNSIVSDVHLTSDAVYLITVEQKAVVLWSLQTSKVIKSDPLLEPYCLRVYDNDTKCITAAKAEDGSICIKCRTIPNFDSLFSFQYIPPLLSVSFVAPVITMDNSHLVTLATHKDGTNACLQAYNAKSGVFIHNIHIKLSLSSATTISGMPSTTAAYSLSNNSSNATSQIPLDYQQLLPMTNDPNFVALLQTDRGSLYDVRKKSASPRMLSRWNGAHTSDGRYGLYAPARGGLELIDLKRGRTVNVLIPKIAEGVFVNKAFFSANDNHVIYYHSGHRSVRVFRVQDGQCLATYYAHANVRALTGSQDGYSLVLGGEDGSVVTLVIADSVYTKNMAYLTSLPSRQIDTSQLGRIGKHKSKTRRRESRVEYEDGKTYMSRRNSIMGHSRRKRLNSVLLPTLPISEESGISGAGSRTLLHTSLRVAHLVASHRMKAYQKHYVVS